MPFSGNAFVGSVVCVSTCRYACGVPVVFTVPPPTAAIREPFGATQYCFSNRVSSFRSCPSSRSTADFTNSGDFKPRSATCVCRTEAL